MNLSDFYGISDKPLKINRILVENRNRLSSDDIYNSLKHLMKLSDIGLKLRMTGKTEEPELISDRVFIDESLIKKIKNVLPSSAPIITYLGNRFKTKNRSTPYSFVSALPSSLYSEIGQGNEIIINSWLANDLGVVERDTVEMFWYSPDSLNRLIERNNKFIIKRIVEIKGIWSDSLLMPDFPGISGRESCSDWDAGVLIKMNDIRKKDEDYWKKFRGLPKAFINYNKGKELWGNNFGPATSIRFPKGISEKEIEDKLKGSIDPVKTGFSITNLSSESVKAASESVDFGTLFISLSFFLILASVVLLSLAVSSYFDSKKDQIFTLFAIGFKNRKIEKLLLFESGFIAIIGALAGTLIGCFVNILIIRLLNSVWRGAVQTDTLKNFFSLLPMLTGFLLTLFFTLVFMIVKIKRHLKHLNLEGKEIIINYNSKRNFTFLLISIIVTISLLFLSAFYKDQQLLFCFAGGTVLLITQILFWQYYLTKQKPFTGAFSRNINNLSQKYFSFYPSHAVAPILFIAAGIFTVFITGANKMNFNEEHLNRSGGTGGYLLWCENTIPVKEDLNSVSGKKKLGIDDEQLKDLHFVSARKSSGNDASCLNLNHVTAPPLLGIDPADFISKSSFSFSKKISLANIDNPWQYLNITSENNTIYGIADQTVIEWGLKIKPGDTLILKAESGQPLNVIIAAGLKSSIFQGYVIIGMKNFSKYYPSISGSSIFLVDGNPELAGIYKNVLNERLENYGTNIELTSGRLASFYKVTNTYLSVFGIFGAFGMIIGIAGLGFVLLRNYNHRKREFALMLATGFPLRTIKRMIVSEQVSILFAGVTTGVISALIATLPSIKTSHDIPWLSLILMILAILITGLTALLISVMAVTKSSLILSLKRE